MPCLAESTVRVDLRPCRTICFVVPLGILAVVASCRSPSRATSPMAPEMLTLAGDLAVHDPVIIREHDTFYVFSTGNRRAGVLPIRCSKDLYHWSRCGSVFDKLPQWALQEIPQARAAWAPDISWYHGKYHLYYAVSEFGKNNSAIGLATNRTLDPNNPEYEWVDEGLVVRSHPGQDDWNAIDPQLVIQDERNVWLCWGSFWGGIMMGRIDPADRQALRPGHEIVQLGQPPPHGRAAGVHRGPVHRPARPMVVPVRLLRHLLPGRQQHVQYPGRTLASCHRPLRGPSRHADDRRRRHIGD